VFEVYNARLISEGYNDEATLRFGAARLQTSPAAPARTATRRQGPSGPRAAVAHAPVQRSGGSFCSRLRKARTFFAPSERKVALRTSRALKWGGRRGQGTGPLRGKPAVGGQVNVGRPTKNLREVPAKKRRSTEINALVDDVCAGRPPGPACPSLGRPIQLGPDVFPAGSTAPRARRRCRKGAPVRASFRRAGKMRLLKSAAAAVARRPARGVRAPKRREVPTTRTKKSFRRGGPFPACASCTSCSRKLVFGDGEPELTSSTPSRSARRREVRADRAAAVRSSRDDRRGSSRRYRRTR